MIKKREQVYLLFYFKYFILNIKNLAICYYRINKNYTLCLVLKTSWKWDFFNKYLLIHSTLSLNNYLTNSFIKSWGKVTFRGKSYKIKSVKKLVKFTFRLGYSHWTKIIFKAVKWKIIRLARQKFLILFPLTNNLKQLERAIVNIRQLNVYTNRGVRLSRQLIHRRFGKLSQYVSKLH